jgi:hypothetical protein
MIRLPRRHVHPNDFEGELGICQNLNCLAPLEPPLLVVTLAIPNGTLQTVLCCNCAPEREDEALQVELVDVPPVLKMP